MITAATISKRLDLRDFIGRVLAPEPAVQAVIGVGSIAAGQARPDSDIDAFVFLRPFDPYIVPAEFVWRPADGSFHSIFAPEEEAGEGMQFDLTRLDLAQWADPAWEWPEGVRAALGSGWMAFDRSGEVAGLVAARTAYADPVRTSKLDEAITWLDQHLSGEGPERRWHDLGPVLAHDRLQAAYDRLVQALFACNRRWRPWRDREMSYLLALPWLPDGFAGRALAASGASSPDYAGYMARAQVLRALFRDLVAHLMAAGEYGADPIGEAFVRSHDEPGRAWNMDEWNAAHLRRTLGTRPLASENTLSPQHG